MVGPSTCRTQVPCARSMIIEFDGGKLWCKKTSNPRTGPVYEVASLDNLWTPDELKADAACRCEIRPLAVTMTTEHLRLNYKGAELHFQRENVNHLWTIPTLDLHQDLRQESQSNHLDFAICADGVHSSATTAKLHGQFRSDVLTAMLEAENITCNMVLFHCTTCNTRFPNFHPSAWLHAPSKSTPGRSQQKQIFR